MRGGGHRGIGWVDTGNESAEAAAGFENACSLKLTVGAGHRVDGEAELTGQFTYGRQPGARWQPTVAHAVDDLCPELVKQWARRAMVDANPIPQLGHVLSIAQSRYFGHVQVTVLSGAGISAESGVPTFRDVETGLWAKVDPYEISSSEGWQANPERVWAWYLWRHYMMGSVAPNDGHRAVAAWQDFADVHVVTQNVDNLHERAGSKNVYHLHGSLFEFRCDRCQSAYTDKSPAMAEPWRPSIPRGARAAD